ncbi:MAG TPA: peroxiredoxin family protein [Alphaproteobacteria bacterium]|jgi:peroxiredoxin|nr:peroxiredoxin family protein [Alphaproteobacteria bacterium]
MHIAFPFRRWFSGIAIVLTGTMLGLSAPALADELGPPVGSTAPSIGSPPDQTGKARALPDLVGPKGLVLMFFRSAAWCPYCQAQLLDMNSGVAEIEKRGYKIAALSYDKPAVTAAFAKARNIAFTFLSDPKSEVIDRYRLRDPQYHEGSMAFGVPRPIIFLLDPAGRIQAKLYEETYKTRPPVGAVVAKIDEVNAASK